MNAAAQPGTVYLVGAGPGDPNFLTLRAIRLLETADVILPDDLVSEEVLALAHAGAEVTPAKRETKLLRGLGILSFSVWRPR